MYFYAQRQYLLYTDVLSTVLHVVKITTHIEESINVYSGGGSDEMMAKHVGVTSVKFVGFLWSNFSSCNYLLQYMANLYILWPLATLTLPITTTTT